MKLDKLNLTPKQKELVLFLQSKGLVEEIMQALLGQSVHELVQKPRLHFETSPKSKKHLVIQKSKDIDEDEEEFDYDDEDLEEPDFHSIFPQPLDKYFRRDTFLTGGAVAAIIFEKLTGTKAVINDVDLFYYHYKYKDQYNAEQERYNNLSGEDRAYHICKVKEVGQLNLIQINLEDDFTWWSVIESFDLNYSQVGINLADKQIFFTKNFVEFLEKKVIELVPEFDQEYPLTSYLRGVHKAQDFQVPFYVRDLMQKYIAHSVGSVVFGEKDNVLTVRTNEDDHDGDEFVTEKRLQHWLKFPQMLPYVTPEAYQGELTETKTKKKNQIKYQIRIQLPDEPWVGVVESVYQVFNRAKKNDSSSTAMLSQLERVIPNFYNLRPSMALRLKQLIHSNLFSTKVNYHDETELTAALKLRPELLTKDISIKKLTQVETFLNSHLDFLQNLNYLLLKKGSSIDQILDLINGLSKLDLALIGILETALGEGNYRDRVEVEKDEILNLIIAHNYSGLKDRLESIYKRRLEKNRVVPEEQKLAINPFARYVTEIIQNDQLVLEGKNMSHCVGGYGEKIKRNESRVFHLQVGKNSSTLEVGIYITKIVPKSEKQILSPYEVKEVAHTHQVDPTLGNKTASGYTFTIANRRDNSIKHYFRPVQQGKLKNLFTDKYTISFDILQHRAKFNGNPAKANHKVAELLVRYLNSQINRNQPWIKHILQNHITKDNQISKWPYLKLEE
jgi:hypothetical protein